MKNAAQTSAVIRVNACRPYDVTVGPSLLRSSGAYARKACPNAAKAAIVTDDTVNALYGAAVRASLQNAGLAAFTYAMPAGESSKTLSTLGELLRFFAQAGLTQTDVVLALGGGVPGDVAGFAAACYLRGVPFIQLPTTLLAAVDSSVGGKTAVDLPEGKNLAGVFYQPIMVLQDTDTLKTLSRNALGDGAAEALKYGVIADAALFAQAAQGELPADPAPLIARCVGLKAAFIEEDELDKGRRQLLNFGHTFGHAIEAKSGYTLSHGRAVGMGMVMAARASARMGLCEAPCAEAIAGALARYGLPAECPYGAEELYPFALGDKKRRGDTLTLILPRRIGECFLHPIPVAGLPAYFAAGLERAP